MMQFLPTVFSYCPNCPLALLGHNKSPCGQLEDYRVSPSQMGVKMDKQARRNEDKIINTPHKMIFEEYKFI